MIVCVKATLLSYQIKLIHIYVYSLIFLYRLHLKVNIDIENSNCDY